MPPHIIVDDEKFVFPQGLYTSSPLKDCSKYKLTWGDVNLDDSTAEDAASFLKEEVLDAIRYTKERLYLAGCDGTVHAFRPDVRLHAMLHDLVVDVLPKHYTQSYKAWLVSSTAGVLPKRATSSASSHTTIHSTTMDDDNNNNDDDPIVIRKADGGGKLLGSDQAVLVKSAYSDVVSNLELYQRLDKVESSQDLDSFWKIFITFYEKERQRHDGAFPGLAIIFGTLYTKIRQQQQETRTGRVVIGTTPMNTKKKKQQRPNTTTEKRSSRTSRKNRNKDEEKQKYVP